VFAAKYQLKGVSVAIRTVYAALWTEKWNLLKTVFLSEY